MNIMELIGLELDEYRLVDLIGTGGMSAVYRAHQEELDRDVAVKVLSSDYANDSGYTQRFEREAKMAASLEHPHIVPVYDFGVHEQMSYVVMRLLPGGTLLDRMKSGPIAPETLTDTLNDLAKALDYAHSRGILHRDVKPGNIMFDTQKTVYLVDFGIAKATQSSDVSLTAANIVMGTPSYMAPEQWRDDDLTPAVDQYALAVVVYQAITGTPPFKSDTPHGLMYKHLNETPVLASDVNQKVSAGLAQVLNRALSKEPSDRYRNVRAFSAAFQEALTLPQSDPTIRASAAPEAPPAAPTVPNQSSPPPQPASQPPIVSPVSPPLQQHPQQAASYSGDDDAPMGNKTIMMHVASGGFVGLGLLAVVVAIILAGVFFALRPGSDAGDDAASGGNDSSEIVQTTPETEDATAMPTSLSIPDIAFAGLAPASVTQREILHNNDVLPAQDVVFNPDNQRIASAHDGGIIRLWQSASDTTPAVYSDHGDVVSAVDFSPDGSLLVSGSRDGVVKIREVASGTIRATINAHTDSVRDVAFSLDGRMVASAGEDNTVRLWDVTTGQVLRTMQDSSRILATEFLPGTELVASGGRSGTLNLWNTQTGNLDSRLAAHDGEVRDVAFSPDGSLGATGGTDDRVLIWNMADQTVSMALDFSNDVFSLTFNPDGSLLIVGDRNNQAHIVEVASGNILKTMTVHIGWVLGVDVSPDGRRIATASGDGSVRLWGSD